MPEEKMRWTPAVVRALMDNDLENAIIAATPGGIEAQEAKGQRDFLASTILPKKCAGCSREQLEAIGIEFGEDVDDLFVQVTLPSGWIKTATDHSMHSELRDEKGRIRAGIFYKAAFYDRRADIHLWPRFTCGVEPVEGWKQDTCDYHESEWHGVARDRDRGEIIWSTAHLLEPEPECPPYDASHKNDPIREVWLTWIDRKDDLHRKAREWLDEQYPKWRDPLAYWD